MVYGPYVDPSIISISLQCHKHCTTICCCDLSQPGLLYFDGDGACIHQTEEHRDQEIRSVSAFLVVSNDDKRCDAAGGTSVHF